MNSSEIANLKIYKITEKDRRLDLLKEYLDFFNFDAILLDSHSGIKFDQLTENETLFKQFSKIKIIFSITLEEIINKAQLFLEISKKKSNVFFNFLISDNSEIQKYKNSLPFANELRLLFVTKTIEPIQFDKCEFPNEIFGFPLFYELSEDAKLSDGDKMITLIEKTYSYFISGNKIPRILSIERNLKELIPILSPDLEKNLIYSFHNNNELPIQLSIIIPTYNRGEHLIHLLKSLDNVSGLKIEIILIDDGSTDNTFDSVQKFIHQTPPKYEFKYFYLKRSQELEFVNRVGSIRNLGAMKSRGDHLLFLDSDIYFDNSMLTEDLLEKVGENIYQPYRANLTAVETSEIFETPSQIGNKLYLNKENAQNWLNNICKNNLEITQWAASYFWLLNKETFRAIGGFKNCYTTYGWEDTDFILRAQNKGVSLVPLGVPVLHTTAKNMFTEYKDEHIDRKIKLSEGAQILFFNNLDPLSFRCFYYGLVRAYILYRGLSNFMESLPKSTFLDSLSYENFWRLLKIDLGYASLKINFNEQQLILNHKIFLDTLTKEPLKLGKVLIISKTVSLLPTILFLEPDLGVTEIKSIVLQDGANYLDDLINFKDLIGWRFKSALLRPYKIKSSKLELSLPNKNKEIITKEFKFDSLIIVDADKSKNLIKIKSLDTNTRVFNLKTNPLDSLGS